MTRHWLLLCAAMISAPMPALAQSAAAPANACWMAGQAFSIGATVRAGASVMVCTEDGAWAAAGQTAAAGCFFDGAFYSSGARREVAGIPAIKTVCVQNGTWREFGATEQPQAPGGGRGADQ